MVTSSCLLLLALLAPQRLILKAPEGVDRWEPSGAAVIGDHLWIASDRGGHVARYPLPLSAVNRPDRATRLVLEGQPKVKWEGLSSHRGALYLLETYTRRVWRCDQPDAGCPSLEPIEIRALWDGVLPAPTPYLGLEALSVDAAGALWVGSRRLVVDDHLEIFPRLLSLDGRLVRWAPPRMGARPLGLSGALHHGGALWSTWSLEIDDDDTRAGVAGLLTRAPIDARGQLGPAEVRARFALKPEGVAAWRDQIIVIFDEDKARKGRRGGFRLSPAEDYAVILGG